MAEGVSNKVQFSEESLNVRLSVSLEIRVTAGLYAGAVTRQDIAALVRNQIAEFNSDDIENSISKIAIAEVVTDDGEVLVAEEAANG